MTMQIPNCGMAPLRCVVNFKTTGRAGPGRPDADNNKNFQTIVVHPVKNKPKRP